MGRLLGQGQNCGRPLETIGFRRAKIGTYEEELETNHHEPAHADGYAAAAVLPRFLGGADQADQSRRIVRSPRPEDLEMPLDGFTDWITPIDRFFVRCHTYTPKVNLNEWSLKIDGKVDRSSTLTMDDLRKLPRVDLVGVLECAGNGRQFYEPHVAGTQWAFGSVGNGRWTGVRLRDVLQKAGIQSSATEILCDGADVPRAPCRIFNAPSP